MKEGFYLRKEVLKRDNSEYVLCLYQYGIWQHCYNFVCSKYDHYYIGEYGWFISELTPDSFARYLFEFEFIEGL
jgi:hypothetical protein